MHTPAASELTAPDLVRIGSGWVEPIPLTSFDRFALQVIESTKDDHFYGPWRGGKASSGGGPVGEDTLALHSDGKGGFTAERVAAVHEPYIAAVTKGVPTSDTPTVYMTGGGPASGKTDGLLNNPKTGIPAKGKAARIDPDGAKEHIPEYRAGLKVGDRTIASHVHEESSHMSKAAVAAALGNGHDVVYDSVGNSGIVKLRAKVAQMRAQGATKVVAHYATVPTEVAIARADARALTTGRYVPHAYIKMAHRDVAQTTLAAIQEGVFDQLTVWDNSGPVPKVIARYAKGPGLTIKDKVAWAAFAAKAEAAG